MIVLIGAGYWALASLFMTLHPQRKFGAPNPYPDYHLGHTILKVTPLLLAALVNRLMLLLAAADIVLDVEYHDPSREHYFHIGCTIYAFYHTLQVLLTSGQFALHQLVAIVILTTGIAWVATKSLKLECRLHRLYTATIVAHLISAIIANSIEQTLAVALLGAGDCLLIISRQRDIPYKDQITMLSTYLHVYLLTFKKGGILGGMLGGMLTP